jgi:hypothetical protein
MLLCVLLPQLTHYSWLNLYSSFKVQVGVIFYLKQKSPILGFHAEQYLSVLSGNDLPLLSGMCPSHVSLCIYPKDNSLFYLLCTP